MKKLISIISVIALTVSMMSTVMAEEAKVEYLEDIVVMNGETLVDLEFDVQEEAYQKMVDYKTTMLTFEPVLLSDWDRDANNITTEVQVNEEEDFIALLDEAVEVDLQVGTTSVIVRVTDDNEPLMVDEDDLLGDEDVVETYTVEVVRANVLKDLDVYVDTVGEDIGFETNVLEYEVAVANTTTEAAIMFEVAELAEGYISKVEMTYDGVTEVIGEDEALELDTFMYGSNLVTVEVFLAEDVETPDYGEAVETYTLDLIQSALLDIEVKTGETILPLDPDFDQTVLDYDVSVLYGLEEVTLIAELVTDVADSSIEIDGEAYISGESLVIDELVIGSNLVEVAVIVDGTELVYTVDLVRSDVLIDMDVLYDDDPSAEFDWKVAEMDPGFISIVYDYDVVVKPGSTEVKFDFELEEDSEDVVIKVDTVVYDEAVMYVINPGSNEFEIELFADSQAVEALATYTVTVLNPIPLEDLEVIPVEDFEFDPTKKNQSISVDFELTEVTLVPTVYDDPNDGTISEDVTVTVNGVDIEVTPSALIQSLDEGRNVIVVATEYMDVSYTYTLVITRKYDMSEERDPEDRQYRYTFKELLGECKDGDYGFGDGAYHAAIKAFKYGSNKENEIVIELEEEIDEATLSISYELFKYLTQHKVMLVLIDDEGVAYEVSLNDLKLNRYIKGPRSTMMVELSFEEEDGVVDVEVMLDDQEPEDHKWTNGNSGKSNSKSNNGKKK